MLSLRFCERRQTFLSPVQRSAASERLCRLCEAMLEVMRRNPSHGEERAHRGNVGEAFRELFPQLAVTSKQEVNSAVEEV